MSNRSPHTGGPAAQGAVRPRLSPVIRHSGINPENARRNQPARRAKVGLDRRGSMLRGSAPRQPARQLTPVEQHDLAARIKAGDQVAREVLIVANLRLVANIARRYYSYGATLDDLIQEGSRGLIYAVERYDPETHNTRFSTYASYWIRNTIQRAIAANFSLIRVPDYMFRLNVRSHQAAASREPRMGPRRMTVDRPRSALAWRSRTVSVSS